jgi:hypothetical protein
MKFLKKCLQQILSENYIFYFSIDAEVFDVSSKYWLRIESKGNFCEHGNEPSGSIKKADIFWQPE